MTYSALRMVVYRQHIGKVDTNELDHADNSDENNPRFLEVIATQVIQKTPAEHLVHAPTFELVAVLICAPLFNRLMDLPLAEIGMMTLMFAAVAMVWNTVFNAIFERVERRYRLPRTVVLRVIHACLFEAGLVLMLVPLAAWRLDVGLWEAFVLDIGIVLLFLSYASFFNFAYDYLRARWMSRRALARSTRWA